MNAKLFVPVITVAGIVLSFGCISDVQRVQNQMDVLIKANKFHEARNLDVKSNIGGFPKTDEEEAKDSMLPLVDAAEAKYISERVKKIKEEIENLGGKDQVKAENYFINNSIAAFKSEITDSYSNEEVEKLVLARKKILLEFIKNHGDIAARQIIYSFGITGQPKVDAALYLIKIGLLNSRVNPATYDRNVEYIDKYVMPLAMEGKFDLAIAALSIVQPAPAYVGEIDVALDKAGVEAINQRAEKESVDGLIEASRVILYGQLAGREGYEKTDFVPNWEKVEEQLEIVKKSLIDDDMSEEESEKFISMILEGIKSFFNDAASDRNLTTAELNNQLITLRINTRVKIVKMLEAAIAKAKLEEQNRLKEIAKEIADKVANEVDFESRISDFIALINDRAEPDLNRILGDGARILRLYLNGEKLSVDDATSLLVAATYAGFEDIMNFTISQKADINGVSKKDSLGRTPYLIAMQYGFKPGVKTILANVDIKKADANGYNALHYAVRYASGKTIVELLDIGFDAKYAAKDGVTALMIASSFNDAGIVQALMGISDINAADKDGMTALHYAVNANSLRIVKLLIEGGAKATLTAKSGDSALDLAVQLPSEAIIAYLLDEQKISPTERSVSWCVINGKVIPLTTLVSHGAKVTDRHLAAAVKQGHLDMTKYLVSLGRDVNSSEIREIDLITITPEIKQFLYDNGHRTIDSKQKFTK